MLSEAVVVGMLSYVPSFASPCWPPPNILLILSMRGYGISNIEYGFGVGGYCVALGSTRRYMRWDKGYDVISEQKVTSSA